jgi:hypothetical protein
LSEVVVAVVVIVDGKKYVHQFALLTRAGYFFGKEGCPSVLCVVLIPTYVGDQNFSPPTHFLWRQIVVSGWRKIFSPSECVAKVFCM